MAVISQDISRFLDYRKQLRTPFTKLCRIRFLQPDGSTAFALDNNYRQDRNNNFIAEGEITVNLQNGVRRTATVTLANVDGEYDYNVNKVWFGQEIALDEGLILSDGSEFYIPQGIFVIESPQESVQPNGRIITYNLVDKWANIDGTLYGRLEGTYQVDVGTNIYQPISALLAEDRGNGQPIDAVEPVFTQYYNNKGQMLPDGTPISMVLSPYTLTVDGDGGTKADVVLGLAEMVNGWVGYDSTGALRIDPSQDDIKDYTRPVLWRFSQDETTLLGMTYTAKNTEVYNDYIVVGQQLDDYRQPYGRAENFDPTSDTNINLIGRKTFVETGEYYTDQQCADLAMWRLKRTSILKKSVEISASQIMHIEENNLVEIVRTDKDGSPIEKHLIWGFTRPLASNGTMTISCTSVNDIADMTIQRSSYALIPTMTSNTTPSGRAFCSWTLANPLTQTGSVVYEPYKAMDGDDTDTGWYITSNGRFAHAEIGYAFSEPYTVTKAEFLGATSASNYTPQTVILQGSSDGVTYVNLSDWVTASSATTLTTVNVTQNLGAYLYYRLYVVSNFTASMAMLRLNYMQLYGYPSEATPIPTTALIPTMSSNTTPYGVASATAYLNAQTLANAYKAFDNDINSSADVWYGYAYTLATQIVYTFDSTVTIGSIAYAGYVDGAGTLTSGIIEYSTDGNTWQTADTFSTIDSIVATKVTFNTPITAKAIRLGATATSNNRGIIFTYIQAFM